MDYLMKPSLMWIQSSGSHECLQLPGSLTCWNICVKLLLEEDAENVVKNLNITGLISRRPTYNDPVYLISEKTCYRQFEMGEFTKEALFF